MDQACVLPLADMKNDNNLRAGLLAQAMASVRRQLGRVNEQAYRDQGWNSQAEKIQYKLSRFRLKLISRKQVGKLDRMVQNIKSERIFNAFHNSLHQPGQFGDEVTFKHSGNAGDVIYALPAIKALSNGRPAKLYLKTGVPVNGWSKREHPLGKSGLTDEMVSKLKPLLESQPWLSSVQVHQGEFVQYDLDVFRQIPDIKADHGDITRWYFWLHGANADLSKPWLEIDPPPTKTDARIVMARSTRYRNPHLSYAFLRDTKAIDFIGTRDEFAEMQKLLPQLRHAECLDFLQLARRIQSASFFIGNQSFPYSVAEALKVPRILETCPLYPNVIPVGGDAAEAFFQPHFEKLVRLFIRKADARAQSVPKVPDLAQ